MSRIRWYGPTLVLGVTVLLVMVLGPMTVRQLAWARTNEEIKLIRQDLAGSPTLAELSRDFRQVANVVRPSVVSIQTATRQAPSDPRGRIPENLRRFFGPDLPEGVEPQEPAPAPSEDMNRYNVPQDLGSGSGWVYDDRGHIVTNAHVVANADVITVRFTDNSETEAEVVAVDPDTDVAVIRVKDAMLHAAARASEAVEQGDIVFAFGSPFRFEFSMSQGIVSAKGRRIGLVAAGRGYENFIQTDAAINPGNSGGPLTNIRGEVVGMNTAIASRTGVFNGIGLAIPVDMVEHVVEQLIKNGKVTRGYLGVYIDNISARQARTFNFDKPGVLVVADPIQGSPAEKAGVKRDDIITRVAGVEVRDSDELRNLVASYAPGTQIKLTVFRKGALQDLDMTIAAKPDDARIAGAPAPSLEAEPAEARVLQKLGLTAVSPFNEELAEQLEQPYKPGVIIESVRRRSAADAAMLRRGFVITKVMDVPVSTPEQLANELAKIKAGEILRLTVYAGAQERSVFVEMPHDE
jgi:serine protease Do